MHGPTRLVLSSFEDLGVAVVRLAARWTAEAPWGDQKTILRLGPLGLLKVVFDFFGLVEISLFLGFLSNC